MSLANVRTGQEEIISGCVEVLVFGIQTLSSGQSQERGFLWFFFLIKLPCYSEVHISLQWDSGKLLALYTCHQADDGFFLF